MSYSKYNIMQTIRLTLFINAYQQKKKNNVTIISWITRKLEKKDYDLKSLLQKEAENNNTKTVNKSIDYS